MSVLDSSQEEKSLDSPKHASSSVEDNTLSVLTVDEEKAYQKLKWKCDLKLLPPLVCLFVVTFVDRTNIANAKIQGMTTDLHMVDANYNMTLWLFNIPYILCGLPSNLLMKKRIVSPGTFLVGLMLCWSVITIGQGVTSSFKGLLVCRFLMGIFEAGFVPGGAYLISQYYRRNDFLTRYAVFFSSALLAGAFGGFLAYAIAHMDGVAGYAGWRWIFIIEGLITIVAAIAGWFLIPDVPEYSTFLKPEEKTVLLKVLAIDRGPSQPNSFSKSAIMGYLKDPKIWLGMLAYLGADNAASSIVGFQPTILNSLGFTASQAQVHTIPVYIVALVCLNISSYFSDRTGHRYAFCMLGAAIGLVGWIVEYVQVKSVAGRYFGMFAIATGAYMQMPVIVVWTANNMGGLAKSAWATGFVISIGNCGNLISSNVFITNQTPRYPVGYGVGMGLTLMTMLCITVLEGYLWSQNKKKATVADAYITEESKEQIDTIGDSHPNFKYIL